MTLRLKALGLALMAVIAIGAVSATAAQAGEFTAEKYPATITGTPLAKHQFHFIAGTVTCNSTMFHGNLAAASNTLTLKAEYSECSTPGGAVNVFMNSCDYVLHAGETLEEGTVDGSLDIKCAEGDEIEFKEPGSGCIVKLPPQIGTTTLKYTNHKVGKDFDLDVDIETLLYKQTEECPGGVGIHLGHYTGQNTITGEQEGEGDGVTVD
jgi:hypothetical protein